MKPLKKPAKPTHPKEEAAKPNKKGLDKFPIDDSDGALQQIRLQLLSLPQIDATRPKRIVLMIHLASIYWRRAEYPAALSLAKQAVALAQQEKDNESISMGYMLLTTIYTYMEDFDSALQNAKRAIVYTPQSPHALYGLLIIYELMGDEANTQKWVQRILAEHPTYPMVYENIANTHIRHNEFVLAEETFRKALQLDVNSVGAITGLGALFIFLERYDEALTILRRLQQTYNNQSSWNDHTGYCYYRMGKWEEATRHLEKGVELDPIDSLVSFIILGVLARSAAGDAARQTSDGWFQRAKDLYASKRSRMIGSRLIEHDAFAALTLTGMGDAGVLALWQHVLASPDTKLLSPITWADWFYHLKLLAQSPHATPIVNEVIDLLTQYRTAQTNKDTQL